MLTQKLRLHDVQDAEALCRSVITRSGVSLQPHDYEDCLAYLIATAWELSRDFEPHRTWRSFAPYCQRILARRLTDWQRQRLGRTRWQFADRVYERPRPQIHSFDDRVGELDGPITMDAAPVSVSDLLGLHREGTSPEAQADGQMGGGAARRAA